jgi:hypothetical protein
MVRDKKHPTKDSTKSVDSPLITAPPVNPVDAIAVVSASILKVVDTWKREEALTERVRLECRVAIETVRARVYELEVKKSAWKSYLKNRAADRSLLERNLQKFWKQVAIWDDKFKGLNFEEMKVNRELLNDYMQFKIDVLSKIDSLMQEYYRSTPEQRKLLGE